MARSIHPCRHAGWLLFLLPALVSADTAFTLDAAEWSRPRTGDAVAAMPTVREAVRTWSQTSGAELAIRHPRGEAGVLWAEELRDWLVALGVPADAVALDAAGRMEDQLELNVRPTTGGGSG